MHKKMFMGLNMHDDACDACHGEGVRFNTYSHTKFELRGLISRSEGSGTRYVL